MTKPPFSAPPDLVEVAAAAEAFVAGFDQEERNALRAAFLGGPGADDDKVRALAVGDVGLAARQFPAIAVGPRNGLHALKIAASARLGHGDGGDRRSGDHAGQVALLLLLAAVVDEIVGDDVGLQGKTGRRSHVAQFLADDGVEGEVESWAAIGFGHLRAEQARRADLAPGFALDDAVMLMGIHARFDHVGEDSAYGVAKGVMVFGEQRAVGGVDHAACG